MNQAWYLATSKGTNSRNFRREFYFDCGNWKTIRNCANFATIPSLRLTTYLHTPRRGL